jgi:hypothetical protein
MPWPCKIQSISTLEETTMSEGKRPGGLTALAVINFIFAGLRFLNVLSLIALFALFSMSKNNAELNKASQEIKKALDAAGIGQGFLIFIVIFSAITALLLLISAIGYLKQKKIIGRILGNVCALLIIIIQCISATQIPATAGGGFSLSSIIGIIYPLLTLFLLNTTFKEDLVN